MTDTSSLPITHSTPQPYPVTAPSLPSPNLNGSLSDTNPQEEEDYTIKCVCVYSDDDGNTVLCEKCDTWQHIECYYPGGRKVPDEHFCNDCVPKEIDGKRATERQKRIREQLDGGDRKVKRPTPKSHKKKTKDSVETPEQVNGWHIHERHTSLMNGGDQPPAKKPKTSHRPSGSIASVNGHGLPEARKRASSNLQSYPSPSKSPQELYRFPSVPTYTAEFLELYDRDEGGQNVSPDGANVYTIPASNKLSAWREDPSLFASEKGGNPSLDPPFNNSDALFDSSTWPEVSLELKTADANFEGRYPSWRLLRLQQNVRKDDLVGEVRGQVGLFDDYCQPGAMNRWTELRHPDPFVFFHPHMNIYIDSRREGTQFRYLRRSCRPNVTLKTFVSADGEYHHCFVASKDISAGTELTTHWYLDPGTFNPDVTTEESQSKRITWASKVLANFGDCACDRSSPCYLARLDYRYSPKSLGMPTRPMGRKRKQKTRHAISPLSTGQATNSRAGSEAIKIQEEDDQYDRRSTSTSSRSHPDSRDMTPTQLGSLDEHPILGAEMTLREKRKIAALEESFKRAERSQQSQKKKKRLSGGSSMNTPSVNASKLLGFGSHSNPTTPSVMGVLYPDPKASRPFSGSPPPLRPLESRQSSDESPCRPSSSRAALVGFNNHSRLDRPSYVDVKMQTDPEEPESAEVPPLKRRKFSTPTQRLLRRVLEDRAKYDQHRKLGGSSSPIATSSVDLPDQMRQVQRRGSMDVEMKDAGVSMVSTPDRSPVDVRSPLESPNSVLTTGPVTSPPFPLPSQAAHSQKTVAPPGGPRLHLSTLPPVPSFAGGSSLTNTTPGPLSAVTPSPVQSLFAFASGSSSYPGLTSSSLPAPSPARKKLSLGDYMSRKNQASTPAMEKSQAQADVGMEDAKPQDTVDSGPALTAAAPPSTMIKPSESIKQEAAAMGGAEGTAVDDAPMKDESDYSPRDIAMPHSEVAVADTASVTAPIPATLPSSQVSVAPAVQPAQPGAEVRPEVAAVLAQLQQMSAHREKGRSHSASSS